MTLLIIIAGAIIIALGNRSLGITEALQTVEMWKVIVHTIMIMLFGAVIGWSSSRR